MCSPLESPPPALPLPKAPPSSSAAASRSSCPTNVDVPEAPYPSSASFSRSLSATSSSSPPSRCLSCILSPERQAGDWSICKSSNATTSKLRRCLKDTQVDLQAALKIWETYD
ncbi:uncharacterized protein LOC119355691 [Triticum dicoccoides]|uniref:uncharacterized protein LOC119355691 n=1 Tax=Triticum dicoccoides TaxID=85692 RepID=UPI00188ECE2D|nr:uncharacterized protein LOC119355691 [Triticum dicoccoides]